MQASRNALRVDFALLGAVLCLVAVSILAFGARQTGATTERLFNWMAGGAGASEEWPATMDSELRFYAAILLGYGVSMCLVAWRIERYVTQAFWLIALFFLGGLGRLASLLLVGPPHPASSALMGIELALPLIFWLLWRRAFGKPFATRP